MISFKQYGIWFSALRRLLSNAGLGNKGGVNTPAVGGDATV